MRLRKVGRLSMLAGVTGVLLVSCAHSNDSVGPASPSAAAEASVVSTPVPSASPTEDAAGASAEQLLSRNFDAVVSLPDDGFYYGGIVAASDEEIVLIGENEARDRTRLAKVNRETRTVEEWFTYDGELAFYSVKRSGELGVEGLAYAAEEPNRRTVVLKDGELVERPGIRSSSPDGKWAAVYEDGQEGIGGTDVASGSEVRWTKGANDAQPLWLPDSSGFLFLQDTGERLGDGAGPKYALATFDIETKRIERLPYEQGFWGRIEWLVPGRVVLARNGFDDGIGLKLVDLAAGTEKQLVSTADLTTQIASHSGTERVLVAERDSFVLYSAEGNELSRMPWPVDLDEYTGRNPDYDAKAENERAPYYKSGLSASFGISGLRFLPDGKRISFELGAIGASIGDVVTGTKLYTAAPGGGEPEAVTMDYLTIGAYEWTSSGRSAALLFALPDSAQGAYIGWKDVPARG
ncbi:hypothetical protein [Cohnella fermenti]|uniref:Lipoprotein LpqB beta-propeller domain-containing protein n=1 Tax=Cohnella fermenti TaxID=2565925 RepID=A0A4S4C0X9_9BACL|nr:hypothetical protein [Cohnella fermenti]THF81293.1 hypothetical protein E6C55_09290 [Cohnella fermenti]